MEGRGMPPAPHLPGGFRDKVGGFRDKKLGGF